MALALRRTKPADPAAPSTEAEVDAAIRALDVERAEIQARIAAFNERERQLVEQGADDDALDQLDEAHRRDQRQLARLAVREEALIRQGARVRGEAMRAAQADLVGRYEAALVEAMRTYRAAACARWALTELRDEAIKGGLERALPYLPLPNVNLPLSEDALAHFEHHAMRQLRSLSDPADPAPQFRVRFIASATWRSGRSAQFYRAGEVATLSAADAAALVKQGRAEWFVPPAPDQGDAE